ILFFSEEAIKLLSNQNMQMKSHIKGLESAMENQSKLENQVAKVEQENKILHEFNEQILKSSTVQGSDPKTVDLLLEKLQHLERKMFALRGDREKQYEEMRRIHKTLQTRARNAKARNEALNRPIEGNQPPRNLQELCEARGSTNSTVHSSIDLNVKDLEAALIQMSGRREYLVEGTDADVHPRTSKTPENEGNHTTLSAISYPTDNAHTEAAEKLNRAHRLSTTRHQVTEEHQRAMKNATDQFDLTQICADTRLPEPGSSRIIGPGPQLALPITVMEWHKSTDAPKSLPGERPSLEEGENLFEINLGEISLTLDQLEACPNGVLCILRFYNFEVQSIGIVRGKRSNFNLTVQYPVIMDELIWTYLHEKHCNMELHKVLPDLPSQEIDKFELGLQYLLQPDSYACKKT
ncbi:Protein fantom, partial [Taenia solium]